MLVILLTILFNLNPMAKAQNCDLKNEAKLNKYFRKEGEIFLLSNFQKFNDLLLDCNQTYELGQELCFKPKGSITIDSSFELSKLISNEAGKSLKHVFFVGFKGIDTNTLPIRLLNFACLDYCFSKFDFYINNTVMDISHCKKKFFKSNFFSNFINVNIYYSRFPKFICPYIFLNSYITFLYITDISDSFLNKNRFDILPVDDLGHWEILIKRLNLELKYESLTTRIINRNVFECVTNLYVVGVVNNIQTDLFLNFTLLKCIDFQIDNLKELFQRGNKWMMHLNDQVEVNLSNQTDVDLNIESYIILRFKYRLNISFFDKIYEYPDEDFCLFQHFPHEHLVLPIIIPGKRIECSCTLLYLIQYYSNFFVVNYNNDYDPLQNYEYYELISPNFNHTIKYCHDTYFNESLLKCNFKKRLENCKHSNFDLNSKENYDSEFKLNNDVDLIFFFKWLQLIFIIILQPILSFVGIINNTLIIIVIRNKSMKKNFKDVMYSHIVINCYFNIFYCLIINLRLMNECVFYLSDTYCSSVYYTQVAQYIKIYVVYFLGNAIKICKNITYISFTFSRFILSSNKKTGLYHRFTVLNIRRYLYIILGIGLALSLFKVFQYKISSNFDLSSDSVPKEKYSDYDCMFNYSSYCVVFKILKIVNNFINDILFFFANMIIDLVLLKDLRENLRNKQILNAKNENIENLKSKEINAKRMVIVTNLFYFFSYLPEFLSTIITILYSNRISYMNFNFSANLINEIFEVFGLVSILSNFYIFLIFNKIFHASFIEISNKLFERLKNNINQIN